MSLTIVLYDKSSWRKHLFPLTATRPVSDLRIGICTIKEKWEKLLNAPVTYHTVDYLSTAFPFNSHQANDFLVIRANLLPTMGILDELDRLDVGEVLLDENLWLAYKTSEDPTKNDFSIYDYSPIQSSVELNLIEYPEDIFLKNKDQMLMDFNLLTEGRVSQNIGSGNNLYGEWLFVEEGAHIEGASLNTLAGPIYVGKNAIIEEGAYLRGNVAIADGARVKIGARLYPNVLVGPGSTIAGEINNTVIWGNSAKGHEGYLGCSVIGEGCNIGAGTSNSNLKNNWKSVSLYDYELMSFRDTSELKCGMIMGDYAMLGINSSVNTGTVIGVGSQIAMVNNLPKFIPDFSWLVGQEMNTYDLGKFLEMLDRRNTNSKLSISENISIFEDVFENTKYLRI